MIIVQMIQDLKSELEQAQTTMSIQAAEIYCMQKQLKECETVELVASAHNPGSD